jgi:hypothetical protein
VKLGQSWGRVVAKTGCVLGCFGLAALAVVIGPGLIFGLMLFAASERTIYSRERSPDQSLEARVQFDDCGAPCGWAKVVFIKDAWLLPDTPLLSCRAFEGYGTNQVRLKWASNSTLLVRHGFPRREIVDAPGSCGSISVVSQFDPSLVSHEP